MRNIILALAIIFIVPSTTLAQDSDLKNLFGKYKNKPGFEIEIEDADFDMDIDDDFDLGSFLNNLKTFYILECEHHETAGNDLANFESKLNKLIAKKNFNTIIDVQSDESFTMMTRKTEGDVTTDVLIIVKEDNESTYIWASGE